MILKGQKKSKTGALKFRSRTWFNSHKSGFTFGILEPPLFLLFLTIIHLFNPKLNPFLFDYSTGFEILGICSAAASVSALALMVRPRLFRHGSKAASLGLNVRVPTLPHRARSPGILELLSPFLKTSMWESQELAMVMHQSYDLMKKHVAFIRTLSWTDRYTSRPSNFMMSEAISLILKLLPPVEKHSATCAGCK